MKESETETERDIQRQNKKAKVASIDNSFEKFCYKNKKNKEVEEDEWPETLVLT